MGKWFKLWNVFAGLATLSSNALAHNTTIEEQALYRWPAWAPPQADYSWESPRVLNNVVDSQAVFAYLTWGDVDVYQFTITPQDVQYGPVLVSASALPPGCFEYRWEYPVTALIGPQAPSPMGPPGLPAPDPSLQLPFEVPTGMGVVFADNPWVRLPQHREVFQLEESDLGVIRWFLPLGLSQHCLLEAQWECDFSHSIAQPVFYPGTYFIAMWNPTGIPTDYTANIGYSEGNYEPADPEIIALVRDYGIRHRSCHEPYPSL